MKTQNVHSVPQRQCLVLLNLLCIVDNVRLINLVYLLGVFM